MNVFISWSGERSKQVGLLLRQWMRCVLQAVRPWMSDIDLDRGTVWFQEISKELANCSTGIVCLTKENLGKPWVLFETGALAKGLTSSRVFTFLIDVKPTDVSEPLSQFNHTFPEKVSMRKLVTTLNSHLDSDALPSDVISQVFDTYWPQFEAAFDQIIETTDESPQPTRDDSDIIIEILSAIRRIERRISYVETNVKRDPYAIAKEQIRYYAAEKESECDLVEDSNITRGKITRGNGATFKKPPLLRTNGKKKTIEDIDG